MKVLVACEESQAVTKEFRKLGYDAYSCDVLPCSGGHPEWHLQQDVTELLKEKWDLIIAFPPCFTEETLILTLEHGYIPISEVKVGDHVLTHKGRWRKVYNTMVRKSNHIRRIKSSNNLLTQTTDEHPYYVRRRESKTVREGRKTKRVRTDHPAEWVDSKDLTKQHFTAHQLPPEKEVNIDDDTLWLMGRYVADGWLREDRNHEGQYEAMIIAVGSHKLDEFEKSVNTRTFSKSWGRTAYKCSFSNRKDLQQFGQFGIGAKNKSLPTWVLSLPKHQAKVFLEGYLSGDGHENHKTIQSTSISPKLTLGIYCLMAKVYCEEDSNTPTIPSPNKRTEGVIEGRTVNMSLLYTTRINKNVTKAKTYFENNCAWAPIRSNERLDEEHTVYNISVEEDESYTANGVVVHNCTFLTVTGNRWFNIEKYGEKAIKRHKDREEAIKFFMMFANADCEHIAIENPVGVISSKWRKPDQIIQPYQFGDPFEKKTCLWLKGLPKLEPTNEVEPAPRRKFKSGKTMPAWYADAWKLPKDERAKLRSKTFPGIAKAMATQWDEFLKNKYNDSDR